MVNPSDRAGHEHFVLSKIIETAAEIDQINVPTIAALEIAIRRLQLIEAAYATNPHAPDYSLADFYMGYATAKGNAIVAPGLAKFVAGKASERSATRKEARKFLDEQRMRTPGGGKKQKGDKGDGKVKDE